MSKIKEAKLDISQNIMRPKQYLLQQDHVGPIMHLLG